MQGGIEKSTMLRRRFEDFVQQLSLDNIDCHALNALYQVKLGAYAVMMADGYDVCAQLHRSKKQYAVTNGTAMAQTKKLQITGLGSLFDDIFISDVVGYEKPDVRFFQHAFSQIPDFNPQEALLIGDSLSSDMTGANNAGIDCCWFNPKGKVNEHGFIRIDYEIKTLQELLEIVG